MWIINRTIFQFAAPVRFLLAHCCKQLRAIADWLTSIRTVFVGENVFSWIENFGGIPTSDGRNNGRMPSRDSYLWTLSLCNAYHDRLRAIKPSTPSTSRTSSRIATTENPFRPSSWTIMNRCKMMKAILWWTGNWSLKTSIMIRLRWLSHAGSVWLYCVNSERILCVCRWRYILLGRSRAPGWTGKSLAMLWTSVHW